MPIAGLVAGALCASVGWMVVTQGLRAMRSERRHRRATEQALVIDCLANVDRVIDVPTLDRRTPDVVIDLRRFEPAGLDHVIDLSNVRPRHAPVPLLPRPEGHDDLILEQPSIWRPPRTSPARSAAATA